MRCAHGHVCSSTEREDRVYILLSLINRYDLHVILVLNGSSGYQRNWSILFYVNISAHTQREIENKITWVDEMQEMQSEQFSYWGVAQQHK